MFFLCFAPFVLLIHLSKGVDILQSCAPPNADNCKTGLVCDTKDWMCRVDILQSCAPPNADNCKTGLVCDTMDWMCKAKNVRASGTAGAGACQDPNILKEIVKGVTDWVPPVFSKFPFSW